MWATSTGRGLVCVFPCYDPPKVVIPTYNLAAWVKDSTEVAPVVAGPRTWGFADVIEDVLRASAISDELAPVGSVALVCRLKSTEGPG